jgi:hypothetical protein
MKSFRLASGVTFNSAISPSTTCFRYLITVFDPDIQADIVAATATGHGFAGDTPAGGRQSDFMRKRRLSYGVKLFSGYFDVPLPLSCYLCPKF